MVVYPDSTLRQAADHMVNHDVGRLPVISRVEPGRLVGILTRSDLLGAHRKRLEIHRRGPRLVFSRSRKPDLSSAGRTPDTAS